MSMGAGPGEDTCAIAQYVYTTYLYDNGIQLATFDGNDNVIDMFVNGPQGIIASYRNNDDNDLHYYLTDQIGSTRLTMTGRPSVDTAKVTAWYNYHAFGELDTAYESYSTPFRFTSKELDEESDFGLYYFGARSYSAELARFITVDKAGQFASGYVYGGNNPIIGVDPDGNFFGLLVPALWGALYAAGPALAISAIEGDFSNFSKSVLAGALTGGIASGLTGIAGAIGNNVAFGAMANIGANAATSSIMGDGITLAGLGSSTLGNFATSGIMGEFNAVKGSWVKNVARETAHMSLSGAISGGVSAISFNALKNRPIFNNFGKSAGYGAIGGASGALWKSALIGAPTLAPPDRQREVEVLAKAQDINSMPVFRTGGLARLLWKEGGFAGLGRDVIVNHKKLHYGVHSLEYIQWAEGLWSHEAQHYFQYVTSGYGKAASPLTLEFIKNKFFRQDTYSQIGSWEWEAEYLSRYVRGLPY